MQYDELNLLLQMCGTLVLCCMNRSKTRRNRGFASVVWHAHDGVSPSLCGTEVECAVPLGVSLIAKGIWNIRSFSVNRRKSYLL